MTLRSQSRMKASARKRGPQLYKPVIVHPQSAPPFNIARERTEIIPGRFFTREDAVARAQAVIEARIERQAKNLAAYEARHGR